MWLFSCTSPPHPDSRQLPDVSSLVEIEARERSLQQRTRIPAEPVELSGDYARPMWGVRQLFRWSPGENEWRLTFVDPQSSVAGFTTRRSVAIPRQRRGMALYFELQPPEAGDLFAIGLRDAFDRQPDDVPIVPISGYRLFLRVREDRAVFAIPLRDFEQMAVIRAGDGTWTPSARGLNWRTIRGVQWVVLEPEELAVRGTRQIRVRNLQIVPKTGILPLQD